MITFSEPKEGTQDFCNREIIKKLVRDYFSLDFESNTYFSTQLMTPVLPDEIAKLINYNDDLRITKKIDDQNISGIERQDEGWAIFKHRFYSFQLVHDFNYENFRSGKIRIDKNDIKIRKVLVNFYLDERRHSDTCYDLAINLQHYMNVPYTKEKKKHIIDAIDAILNKIGACTMPKKDKLVINISVNFADWFLCATKENWSTCLDLESCYEYAYWTGIPGLIGDKNRIMISISGGDEKEYQGIVAQKIITRTWGILTKDNKIKLLNWYPHKVMEVSLLNEAFDTNIFEYADDDNDWESKYPIHFLYDEEDNSRFIYQDYSKFEFINDDVRIVSSNNSTHIFINKNDKCLIDRDLYTLDKNLKDLMNARSNVLEQSGNGLTDCDECGNSIYDGEENIYDNTTLCNTCYEELVVYTANAGTQWADNCIYVDSEDEWFTARHVERYFVESVHDGEWYRKEDCFDFLTDRGWRYMLAEELQDNIEEYTELHDLRWTYSDNAVFSKIDEVYYSKQEWEKISKKQLELSA